MEKDLNFERPTFAKWKKTHQRQATSSPDKYDGKHDTRKAYHWVVLENLQYEDQLIDVEQDTWFGHKGQPTATGKILSTWLSHGRKCFLVEAWNRKSKDLYLVVFSQEGKFITAYSKTKEDIPDIEFRVSRKKIKLLLRLSIAVGTIPDREITEEAISLCVARKALDNQTKHINRFKESIIPTGVEYGLIKQELGKFNFSMPHAEIERAAYLLNPYGWEDFLWQRHEDPYI